jgi:nitroimidazol reductase NimA-like FMN-containing flavoprotein (pyridoxamine 5'-phosphate oxidase superfamily)
MSVFNYDSVRAYSLDEQDERELVETQKECTFIWSNKEGWPVGVIMSYVWRDGAFWLSISSLRVRVAAVTRDPRVAICVTSLGTALPSGRTVTYKGYCEVFSDEETKAWFLPALAERLRAGDPEAQELFIRLNDTPNRRVLKVTPTQRIGYDGRKMAKATAEAVEAGVRIGPSD